MRPNSGFGSFLSLPLATRGRFVGFFAGDLARCLEQYGTPDLFFLTRPEHSPYLDGFFKAAAASPSLLTHLPVLGLNTLPGPQSIFMVYVP
jgi:hypothetical protein